MTLFIMGALATVAAVFLLMIAVQILKIEKCALDITDIAEVQVSRLYEEPIR